MAGRGKPGPEADKNSEGPDKGQRERDEWNRSSWNKKVTLMLNQHPAYPQGE